MRELRAGTIKRTTLEHFVGRAALRRTARGEEPLRRGLEISRESRCANQALQP